MFDATPIVPRGLDRTGFVLSTACAVHCALMPLVAGLLPLVGLEFLSDLWMETALLLAAASIAVWSLSSGCRHHGRFGPLALTAGGFGLVLAGRSVATSEAGEATLVVAGALLVASAHLLNWRLCCGRGPAIGSS